MAYQVIARKWRPKTFDELVGQRHISQSLKNAVETDRLPHALLFTGPRGTGKTSSARILARMLRAPNPQNPEEEREAQLISEGRSLDVIEIDGASNNGVDAVRDLREGVKYKPSSGRFKVYIIDEVHMLSMAAFNALLKTLEEPPEHAIFILATTEVHKIPQTILSRCQRFDFRRIGTKEIVERLKLICEKDKIDADEDALWVIARQADGAMRDSQSLLDQVITFAGGKLTLEGVVAILGLTDRSLLLDTMRSLVYRDKGLMLELIQRIFEAGYDPKLFAQNLLEELRHLLLTKLGIQGLDFPDSEVSALSELAEALPEEDIHFLFDMALKGADDIPRSADPSIVLEMLLLRMVAAPRIEALASLMGGGGAGSGAGAGASGRSGGGIGGASLGSGAGRGNGSGLNSRSTSDAEAMAPRRTTSAAEVEGPQSTSGARSENGTGSQSSIASAPTRSSQAAPSAAITQGSSRGGASPAAATTGPAAVAAAVGPAAAKVGPAVTAAVAAAPTTPQGKWDHFVQLVRDRNPIFAAKLTAFVVSEATENGIRLGVPTKNRLLASQLKDPAVHKQLRSFASELLGEEYEIEIIDGQQIKGESIQERTERTEKESEEAIRKRVNDHPLVRSAKSVFNGEIVEIKDQPKD